jgi:hypothetical protein
MEPAPFRRFGEYFQSDCDKWMNGVTDDEVGAT